MIYKNKDKFQVDDKFQWSLIKKNELRIEFENKWINADSFESTLVKFDSPLEVDVERVEFILPVDCKFLLDALGRFLALSNQLADKGLDVVINFDEKSKYFYYLNRLGFFDHLLTNIQIIPKRPENSTAKKYEGNNKSLLELRAIEPQKKNKTLINQLSDCFVQLSSKKYDSAASTIFGELIGNIVDHSNTKLNGVAGLQKYEGKAGHKSHIQTIVSDSGLGISTTLRPALKEHHPELFKLFQKLDAESDIQLVKATLSKGEISRLGPGHGLGFKSSKDLAMKFEANFSIRQEKFGLDFLLKNGNIVQIKEHKNLAKIIGTHICFDFYID